MSFTPRRFIKTVVLSLGAIGFLVLIGLFSASVMARRQQQTSEPAEPETARLVDGTSNTLALAKEVRDALDVRTIKVESSGNHEQLSLSGSLLLDSNKTVHVHSRFKGEVVSIGPVLRPSPLRIAHDPEKSPSLRLGDKVKKGQFLAVIWSKDVGEAKSNLVDALSQLYLDELQVKRLQSLSVGAIADNVIKQAEQKLESDVNRVETVKRTLRSWRLTEQEIAAVESEAEKIHKKMEKQSQKAREQNAPRDRKEQIDEVAVAARWAEVNVTSPIDGTILEQNIAVGDIVDVDLNLFQIADLSTLAVLAHVYEEDLPALQAIPEEARRWTVQLRSQPQAAPSAGFFDHISDIVDPTQHTAAIMGWMPNPDGRLLTGQFITASVELPAAPNEVIVPAGAVTEDGSRSTVFVALDKEGTQVTRRNVAVVRRSQDIVVIRSQPTAAEQAAGCEPLEAGQWVVTAGTVELDGALEGALASVPARSEAKN